MPCIKVNLNQLSSFEDTIKQIHKRVDNIKSDFYSIGSKLDWDVKKASLINRNINNINDDLSSMRTSLKRMRSFLSDAQKNYKKLDKQKDTEKALMTAREKREQDAKLIKTVVTGLAIVGTIAVCVSPIGFIGATLISGAISGVQAAVNTGADIYVEKGSLDATDALECARVGAITGGTTIAASLVGGGLGKAVSTKAGGAVSAITKNPKLIKLTTKTSSKMVTGAVDTIGTVLSNDLIENGNLSGLDAGDLAKRIGVGIVSDIGCSAVEVLGDELGEAAGNWVVDKIKTSNVLKETGDTLKITGKISTQFSKLAGDTADVAVSGLSEISEGFIKRIRDVVSDDLDASEILSADHILSDLASGISGEAAKKVTKSKIADNYSDPTKPNYKPLTNSDGSEISENVKAFKQQTKTVATVKKGVEHLSENIVKEALSDDGFEISEVISKSYQPNIVRDVHVATHNASVEYILNEQQRYEDQRQLDAKLQEMDTRNRPNNMTAEEYDKFQIGAVKVAAEQAKQEDAAYQNRLWEMHKESEAEKAEVGAQSDTQ